MKWWIENFCYEFNLCNIVFDFTSMQRIKIEYFYFYVEELRTIKNSLCFDKWPQLRLASSYSSLCKRLADQSPVRNV